MAKAVSFIFCQIARGKQTDYHFGDGRQTRDFISVHDVVSANLSALHQADGEIINISTETELSLNDLAAEMIAAAGCSADLLRYGPSRTGDIYRSCLSNQKAKALLDWTPSRNIKDGLTETIHFFQDRL